MDGEKVAKSKEFKIETTYPVLRIPYVPNAVRNRPLTLHPIKK